MKTKTLLAFLLLAGFFRLSNAQVTEGEATLRKQTSDTIQGWKKGGVTSLNFAQTSLTNWAAGGEKSLAVNGIFSVFANYKNDKMAWDNSLDLGYGQMKQGNNDFRKTDDKIDFLSKYGQQAYKSLFYAALFNFKTQMTTGYEYPTDTTKNKISNLLAPGYILGALGIDYKPNSHFSAFIAPITGKITIVNDKDLSNVGAFGVDTGKTSKSEFGGYVRVIYTKNDFKNEMLKNVSLTTKADFFSNYLNNPQKIDVSWETLIAFKVNKYISVSVNTHLLYDFDTKIWKDENNNNLKDANETKDRIQFKEILGVGFSYNF